MVLVGRGIAEHEIAATEDVDRPARGIRGGVAHRDVRVALAARHRRV